MNAYVPIEAATVLNLSNVNKHYVRAEQRITIFEGLCLDFKAGEFVAIMGPSGSGKTTLLNILGGIDSVDDGSVLFMGTDIARLGDGEMAAWRARNVGLIFQFYNLMPYLTAAQNIELPLMLTSLSRKDRKQRVELVLDIVGLSERAKHLPSQLSGGQQQRVAIARALVGDPALILADEPTGDLDRATADDVLNMLGLLSRELGKTVIMVTHDREAANHADRTLELNKGRLLSGGGSL